MTERTLPNFHPGTPWGATTCMSKESGELCGNPGRWHVLWDHPGAITSVMCHLHYHEDIKTLAILDHHELGGMCNIPGTIWRESRGLEHGYCYIPLEDDVEAVVHQATPEPVGATS